MTVSRCRRAGRSGDINAVRRLKRTDHERRLTLREESGERKAAGPCTNRVILIYPGSAISRSDGYLPSVGAARLRTWAKCRARISQVSCWQAAARSAWAGVRRPLSGWPESPCSGISPSALPPSRRTCHKCEWGPGAVHDVQSAGDRRSRAGFPRPAGRHSRWTALGSCKPVWGNTHCNRLE